MVVNYKTSQIFSSFQAHFACINSILTISNFFLLSASVDKTIKVWNQNSWTLNSTIKGHTGGVWCLVLLQNGFFASGSSDKSIVIWNIYSLKS